MFVSEHWRLKKGVRFLKKGCSFTLSDYSTIKGSPMFSSIGKQQVFRAVCYQWSSLSSRSSRRQLPVFPVDRVAPMAPRTSSRLVAQTHAGVKTSLLNESEPHWPDQRSARGHFISVRRCHAIVSRSLLLVECHQRRS